MAKTKSDLNITEVRVYPYKAKKGKDNSLKAFASITINGCFAVNGIRIIEGKKGLFVAMPSQYSEKDEEYYDVCFPVSKEAREELTKAVLDKYEEEE